MEQIVIKCRSGLEGKFSSYISKKGINTADSLIKILSKRDSDVIPTGFVIVSAPESIIEELKKTISLPYRIDNSFIMSNEDVSSILTIIKDEDERNHSLNPSTYRKIGDTEIISSGPFNGLYGVISALSEKKITYLVNLFGRETKVEVEIEGAVK